MFKRLKRYLAKKLVSELPITVTPTIKTIPIPLEVETLRAKIHIRPGEFDTISITDWKRSVAIAMVDVLIPFIDYEIREVENDKDAFYMPYPEPGKSYTSRELYGTLKVVRGGKNCNT